jgi:enoyl-CoA hydratase/carnithine racemase
MVEITMRAPHKNALGSEMLAWLVERLEAAAGDAVLLAGTREAFSAGLNLKELAHLDARGMASYLRLLERCMAAFYLYPGPIVACIEGHAIAGGSVLASACDHRVATRDDRVRIGLNEVALGVRFPPRVLRIVRERLPRTSHERVLLGADLFAPTQAHALGLVDELADDARSAARARLDAFAAHPRDAYAATKRTLRGSIDADLASDSAEEAWFNESVPVWTSPEVKSRIVAVLKR